MTINKSILKQCTVFSTLSDGELDLLVSLASEREYEAGTIIFHEGDSADDLIQVIDGRVAVQVTAQSKDKQPGRKITVDIVGKYELAGWSALVEPYKYTMAAVCLQKVTVFALNGIKLRRLMQNDIKISNEILRGLVKVIASRLNETRQLLISERLTQTIK